MEQRGAIMLRSQGKHSPLKSTEALHDQMCRNKSLLAHSLEKSVMPLTAQCWGFIPHPQHLNFLACKMGIVIK